MWMSGRVSVPWRMSVFLRSMCGARVWRGVLGAGARAGRSLSSGVGATSPGLGEQEIPEIPPCDYKPEQYKALPYDAMLAIRRRHLSPHALTYYTRPLLIHQGHMQWLWDSEGRRYLDFFGGIVTISVGHCHPKVTEVAREQMGRLCHTTNIYMHPGINEYMERLIATLPDPLRIVFLLNSGSEANDLAMLLARVHTHNHNLITLRGAYHGSSISTMALGSISSWKFNVSTVSGCHPTMCPDVYRGPWGGSQCRDSPVQTLRHCDCSAGSCQAKHAYIEQLRDVLLCAVPRRLGGFIAEPIQGVNGTVQYPKGFLKEVSEIIREQGGVYISDEVQTGFGRLGSHFWGFQAHGVMPDIVTMAKGIGNGFPMAAVITTPEIAASMSEGINFNTFGGSPLACAIGSAVLDVIEADGLMANSENLGTNLMMQLVKLRDEFEIVGDVRGKGLMVGMEMVTDKVSGTPAGSGLYSLVKI
uniref:alanine--glyoxylate aminotransferase 2, mitochondrial n=1 Tax=Pristiophorus japonicus TaxID=55135 RepID=UPI00398EC86D